MMAQPLQQKFSPAEAGLVTIIVPNYNHGRYLADAIDSILAQDYPHVETIVVDDGSTDNSREVAGRYGEKIRYIFQENQGLSAARNTGLNAARGEFVGVLDADDMYESGFVSTLVARLQADPDADGIYCGYRFVDVDNHPLPQIETHEVPPDKLHHAIACGNFLVPESIFLRRACYEAVGYFDQELTALEDVDMWLRVTEQFRIIGTTQILTRHRILANSMSTDPSRQHRNRMKVLAKHFGPPPSQVDRANFTLRQVYGRAYLTSAVEHLQSRKTDQARQLLTRMNGVYPEGWDELSTYYELACGPQPKGWRGDFESIPVERNGEIMVGLLTSVMADDKVEISAETKNRRLAHAAYTLGLLSYGKGEYAACRGYFRQAVGYDRFYLGHRELWTRFGRTLLGPRLKTFLSRLRRSFSNIRNEKKQGTPSL